MPPQRPEEYNITSFFDILFKSASEKTGVPVEDYSAIFGGQLYAGLVDFGFDLILKPFWSTVFQSLIGVGTMLYSTMAEGVSPRLRKEMFTFGTHCVLELLDPGTWKSVSASAQETAELIKEGDYVNAIFKPPEEVLKTFGVKPKKTKKEKTVRTEEEVPSVNIEVEEEVEEEEEEEKERWRSLSA